MSQKFVLDFEKPIYNLANQLESFDERAAGSDIICSEEIASLTKIDDIKKRIWPFERMAKKTDRPTSSEAVFIGLSK
jgi:hypothetical protein